MLNLKCIAAEGYIDLAFAEEYQAKEKLKPELFTQEGDVLIRLSFPYTSVLIDDKVAYEKMSKAVNPYGDGLACGRIVNALLYRI